MHRHSRMSRIATLLICAGVACMGPKAYGHGVIPEHTPIDRLVTNLEAKLKEEPDDANLHYTLGRLHGLAFERHATSVAVYDRKGEISVADKCWQEGYGDTKGTLPDAELKGHLTEAIKHLNKAIELDTTNPMYHLALGSVLESGLSLADKIEVHPMCPVKEADQRAPEWIENLVDQISSNGDVKEQLVDEALHSRNWNGERPTTRDWVITKLFTKRQDPDKRVQENAKTALLADWKEQISEQFFLAFSQAIPEDGKASEKPIWGHMQCWVAYEAATSYVRVVEKRGVRDDEKVRLATAKAALKAFNDLPRPGGITPFIFSMSRTAELRQMVNGNKDARFDLDGTGLPQSWSWVKPDTGILVWDPKHEGKITSGRQLFGSVTWWIFFDNGYDALDALDDDRDGELSGAELPGLAVWFDRNSNGVSDAGEVVPIESLGIAGISCRATSEEGGCPANLDGLRLADGRVLATYDWIATPVNAAEHRPLTAAHGMSGMNRTAVGGTAWLVLPLVGGVGLVVARRRRAPGSRRLVRGVHGEATC